MRKLGMQIAVVLLLFVGVSTTGNPRIQSSGTSVAQTVASQSTLAPMQTFTSADGRFSILFPGAVKQESQNINLKNGEVTKLYEFSADDDDGIEAHGLGVAEDFVREIADRLLPVIDDSIGEGIAAIGCA